MEVEKDLLSSFITYWNVFYEVKIGKSRKSYFNSFVIF